MDRISAITQHYERINEDLRISHGHGRVEFITSVHYIDQYLHSGMKIIDIGAGTGKYSHHYAQQGYHVDAVELVEKNIDIFKAKSLFHEPVTVTQGDALDLSLIPSEEYDIVLLLGPLYHLFHEKDKHKAISEAIRVAKHGGIIFCAYCLADFSILRQAFQRGKYDDLVQKGMLDPVTFQTHSNPEDVMELCTKQDIDDLMKEFDVERLHFVATDLFTHYIGDEIDSMDKERFETYLRYHYSVCERPDLVGASAHALDIFRKTS